MRPDQFTMWLRGSLDAVGEDPIPADVAQKIYAQLSEVVAQQVAEKLKSAYSDLEYDRDMRQLEMEKQKLLWENQKWAAGSTGANLIRSLLKHDD